MASKLHLNGKVTPWSVAYAAVQVYVYVMVSYIVLCLSVTASSISTCKLRVPGLWFMVDSTIMDYITVVDFFENTLGPATRKHAQDLLNWWSMWVFPLFTNITLDSCCGRKNFPAAALHRQSNTSASHKKFKEQCAALEGKGAWAAHAFQWLSFPLTILLGGHPYFYRQ